MSARIPVIGSNLNQLHPHQQLNTESSTIPLNITQNALQAPASAVNSPIASTSAPNSEITSTIQTIAQNVLAPNTSQAPLLDVLNTWAKDNHHGLIAANKILKYIENKSSTLNLSNLGLTSLPDIFDHPEFYHLQEFHLDDNQLTTLPKSFAQLKSLKTLNLTCNAFTMLPELFRELKTLTHLWCNNNSLTHLPKFFGQLKNLITLDLEYNQLVGLPKSFGDLMHLEACFLNNNHLKELPNSIGDLKNLKELHLQNNQLEMLPDTISGLKNLKTLDLENNLLTVLPNSIGELKALQDFDLSKNRITVLPNSIGELSGLSIFYLENNLLTVLPDSIGELTDLLELYLRNNLLVALPNSIGNLKNLYHLNLIDNRLTNLPQSFLQLQALQYLYLRRNPLTELPNFLRALPNLEIHDLPFSLDIESITEEICRLAQVEQSEALKQLYEKASNANKALLKVWLDKLKETKPGKDKDVHFYKSIAEILELTSTDTSFNEAFWRGIDGADRTCGDGIALTILDLDVRRQLVTLDPKKHLQVADFLKRGIWIYNLLQDTAVAKIASLRQQDSKFKEDVEVRLGYFIKLKEALNLPITMKEMLYFTSSSRLKDVDLQAAEDYVKACISNEESFVDFLIQQDKWKETLKINCTEEFESIKNAYEKSEKESSLETFETALKDLTRQLLARPETQPVTTVKRRKFEVGARELKWLGINPDLKGAPEDQENGRRKIATRSSTKKS